MTKRVVPIYVEKERGDLIERAKAEADKQRRSLSWLVCEALEEYLSHKEVGRRMEVRDDTR